MHSGLWRDFALRLATHARVTLIDLPGHGYSGGLDDFSLDAVVDVLVAAVPRPAHWLGWSLGGLLAIRAASRYLDAVASVGLLAATPRFTADEGWPGVDAGLLGQMAANLEKDFAGTLKRFIGLQTFGQDHARALARQIEARLHDCAPPDADALRGGLAILQQADLRDEMARLRQPALAILGAHDRLVPQNLSAALRQLNPEIDIQVLATAAHLPFLTHEEETASRVVDFLKHSPAGM
jgi:pimeloyl-[acyl-carrier protein] methyl ester esterase